MHCFQIFKGPRGVSGGWELSATMAEPTKQERHTKLMEALGEAFDELEFEIQCFGYAQVDNKISDYCHKFALAAVDLKDEEIQCKEDFALLIAQSCFWQNLTSPDFCSVDQGLEFLRRVVDHLKVLLQPPVADWQKNKTLSALARTFRQMSEQSDICGFYAGHSKIRARCGDVDLQGLRQPGILAQKMREDVIQVAKVALRTQQFKTTLNDDLSAAVKDFLHKVRRWCLSAGKADKKAITPHTMQGQRPICFDCWNAEQWMGCQRTLFLWYVNYGETEVGGKTMKLFRRRDFRKFVQLFSEHTTESQNLRHATSKLLDLSLASELQNLDPQPDISTTSLSSWSMVDMADQEETLEVEVESIASVDSQTSCLSGAGGPHCFLPTCRFKCVEDETSLVREVLGKDAKLLKQV